MAYLRDGVAKQFTFSGDEVTVPTGALNSFAGACAFARGLFGASDGAIWGASEMFGQGVAFTRVAPSGERITFTPDVPTGVQATLEGVLGSPRVFWGSYVTDATTGLYMFDPLDPPADVEHFKRSGAGPGVDPSKTNPAMWTLAKSRLRQGTRSARTQLRGLMMKSSRPRAVLGPFAMNVRGKVAISVAATVKRQRVVLAKGVGGIAQRRITVVPTRAGRALLRRRQAIRVKLVARFSTTSGNVSITRDIVLTRR